MPQNAPIMPRNKLERIITLALGLIVLIGGLLAVAAWRSSHHGTTSAESPNLSTAPAPTATPLPGPLSGWTILVDAGHGGYDGGARCRDSGVWEKHLTLSVALKTETALRSLGAEVLMTRRTDVDLCKPDRPANLTKKRQDMQNRVRIAADGSADLVISIHMNEYRVRSESGPQVFYRAGCDGGRLLAGVLQETLITRLQPKKQRLAMPGDYFILQLDVPSVLVECGFISNPEEEKLLLDEAYQEQLAQAIAEGAAAFRSLQSR